MSAQESTATTTSGGSPVLSKLLDQEAAIAILKLSLNSTASTFADQKNIARSFPVEQGKLRDIGRGSCGSVFEVPGTALAIKKGSNARAIWNDYNLTNRAYLSYLAWSGILSYNFPSGRRVPRVPRARIFSGPEADDFWDTKIQQFPACDQTRAAAFYLDRILPVPKLTRGALIRRFFKPNKALQQNVLNNPANKDCLIRLYFGATSPSTELYDDTETLRNFPLYLNQAREIGLDIEGYAEEMAMGLAVLHWDAQIDAADTEFVIGCSTTSPFPTIHPNHHPLPPPVSTRDEFTRRETQMWMFDYDKSCGVNLETEGASEVVNKYLVAVTGNDPYYPHPLEDVKLWRTFRTAYLKASKEIIRTRRLEKGVATYPQMLIKRWEQWGEEDKDAEESDPFERGSEDEEEATGMGDGATMMWRRTTQIVIRMRRMPPRRATDSDSGGR